jgi:hypothetical protein
MRSKASEITEALYGNIVHYALGRDCFSGKCPRHFFGACSHCTKSTNSSQLVNQANDIDGISPASVATYRAVCAKLLSNKKYIIPLVLYPNRGAFPFPL